MSKETAGKRQSVVEWHISKSVLVTCSSAMSDTKKVSAWVTPFLQLGKVK
jgi:hypothetical protein